MDILSHSEKLKLLDYVIELIKMSDISIENRHYLVGKEISNSNEEFLKLCFALFFDGNEPSVVERIMDNFINNEKDPFIRAKCKIQSNFLIAIRNMLDYQTLCFYLLSNFSYEFAFKNLKETEEELYNKIINYY